MVLVFPGTSPINVRPGGRPVDVATAWCLWGGKLQAMSGALPLRPGRRLALARETRP
jgi:hypothetical protein